MDMNQFNPHLLPEEPNEPTEPIQAAESTEAAVPTLPLTENRNVDPPQSTAEPAELVDDTNSKGSEKPQPHNEVPVWLAQMMDQSESQNPSQQPSPGGSTACYTPYSPPIKPKKRKTWLWIMLICIGVAVTLVIGSTVGFLVGRTFGSVSSESSDVQQEQPFGDAKNDGQGGISSFDIETGKNDGEAYSYEQIVQKVAPAIVNITIYSADGEKGSFASGIIMDAEKGYVLTNDHIYSEVPNAKFLITLNNGTEFTAEFVSGDSRSDIAILKINNPKNLTAAVFSTDTLTVGEKVLAIGQSYGYADTVSEGIVSAVDRRVSLSSGSYSERYIQTTAAINPGNSGGALVNLYGQVVGMTSAKIATEEVEGLGFAIPSDRVLDIVANLQKNGVVKGRAKLGVTYNELGTVAAEVQNLPVGILVQSVDSKSDAAKKGIRSGDVITKVNGKAITIATVLLDVIENANAGDEITLEIYQASNQKTKTVKVKLMEAEGGHSYKVKDEDTNDLPENPYEFYFGEEE